METRRDAIYKIILEEGSATVNELCEKLHYSCATINRDLNKMAADLLIRRRFGIVEILNPEATDLTPKIERDVPLKQKIAKIATSLLTNEHRVFIDGSTSTHFMHISLQHKPGRWIITNNLRLASILSTKGVSCIALGGKFQEPHIVGDDITIMQAKDYTADICFLSAYAISKHGIISDSDYYATLRKIMMKNSAKKVLMVQKEKLGRHGSRIIGDLSDIDVIITDIKFSDEIKEKFSNTTFIEV